MAATLRDELVALTCDMVRYPSTADRPDQLSAVMEYAARYLAAIPGLYLHRSEHNGKPALVATLRDTCTPALFLNAHLDVVAARPAQYTPEIRGERIYGRGSQDMKGSAAVFMRLLKELAARDERPDVGLQLVSDEEIGGVDGTERLLAEGWHCEFLLDGEPTDLRICYEQKGGMRLDVLLHGTPAHASRPWDGRNPLYDLGMGLCELARRFAPPNEAQWVTTYAPTVIAAGGTRNQIPAGAELQFDIRYVKEDTPEAIAAAVQGCFPNGEIVLHRGFDPLVTDPQAAPVQRLAAVNARMRGQPTEFYREHYASDARFYSKAGIPAVCFGPVGAGLHSDDEWVAIDGLVEYYEIVRAFILD